MSPHDHFTGSGVGGLGTKGKMGFWTEELHGRGDKGTKHPTPISLNEHFPAGPDEADESTPQTLSEYLVLLPFPSPFPLPLPLLQKDPSDHLHDTRVFPVCLPSSCIYTLLCPEHALSPPSHGGGGGPPGGGPTPVRLCRFLESAPSAGTEYRRPSKLPAPELPRVPGQHQLQRPSTPPDPDCSAGVYGLSPALLAHGPLPGSCLLFQPLPLVLTHIIALALLAVSSLIEIMLPAVLCRVVQGCAGGWVA